MIKHWEILENKWTENSPYALGVQGEDSDSGLILKELSSFCSLIDAKVPPFTHIFELLNVNDDDILQKIRKKIENIVLQTSLQGKNEASAVKASSGNLELSSTKEVLPEDIFGSSSEESNGLTSSDGTEISIGEAKSTRLENTQTFKDNLSPIDAGQKVKIVNNPNKKEKTGFFKKLFSFGKNKKSEEEITSTPLPIEKAPTTIKNIVPDNSKEDFLQETKRHKKNSSSKGMRGVVVRGTAFPAEELGAQKIKEVTFDDKTIFDKGQQEEVFQSQVPLDDIFAAETICKFYDEKEDTSSDAKISKIMEQTEAPIVKNTILSQNETEEKELHTIDLNTSEDLVISPIFPAKKEAKKVEKPQKPVEHIVPTAPAPQAPKAPVAPVVPVAPQAPKAPVAPVAPVAPQAPKAPVAPAAPQAPKAPVAPAAPVAPQAPKAPVAPAAPAAPQAPKAPVAPVAPAAPQAPKAPVAPVAPVAPQASKAPVAPAAPQAPKAPVAPVAPIAPQAPKAPVAPAAPVAPQAPKAPVAPAAPVAPQAPKAPVAPVAPVAPQAPKAPVAPVAPVAPQAPKAPVAPAAPVAPQAPKAPVAPVPPPAPVIKENKEQISDPRTFTMKTITPIQDTGAKTQNNVVGETKENMSEEKENKQIPQISVSAEETFRVKNPIPQDPPAVLPKIEVNSKDLVSEKEDKKEEGFEPLKKIGEEDIKEAEATLRQELAEQQTIPQQQVSSMPTIKKEEISNVKPITMPHVKDTPVDGFDHTIQTASIPVYKKSNWSIEMPIIPSFTLDNMDMSSNRFAHAAAMSIVSNPGSMYNPFFVFGESGCGKTHFLNAIGAEFSKQLPQDKIFITNGVRFSRGVQRAIEDGSIEKVKSLIDAAEVFIIDDIHLTAVNETNREFISKVLNEFVAKRKQLVIGSKYPPQGLSRFEELIDFKLNQGWTSELKPLRPNHFIKVYNKMATDAHVDLTEAQSLGFFGRDNLTLGMIARDIKRAKVLRRRIQDSGNMKISYDQLLNYITAISGEDSTSEIETMDLNGQFSIRKGENTEWGNFGFFFPKDNSDKFKWIVYATMRRAKELGIKGGFNFALKSAYSTEHIIASAFKIANICDSKSLKAAIILGPDPKIIQPAIRDNFCDILSHMLEVMMIRCAIISYEDIKKPSSYVKVLGDVLK